MGSQQATPPLLPAGGRRLAAALGSMQRRPRRPACRTGAGSQQLSSRSLWNLAAVPQPRHLGLVRQQSSRSLLQMLLPPRRLQRPLQGRSCGMLPAAAGSCCRWSSSGLSCRSADYLPSGSHCLRTVLIGNVVVQSSRFLLNCWMVTAQMPSPHARCTRKEPPCTVLLVHIVTAERVSVHEGGPTGATRGTMPRSLPCQGLCTPDYTMLPLFFQNELGSRA